MRTRLGPSSQLSPHNVTRIGTVGEFAFPQQLGLWEAGGCLGAEGPRSGGHLLHARSGMRFRRASTTASAGGVVSAGATDPDLKSGWHQWMKDTGGGRVHLHPGGNRYDDDAW